MLRIQPLPTTMEYMEQYFLRNKTDIYNLANVHLKTTLQFKEVLDQLKKKEPSYLSIQYWSVIKHIKEQ